MREVSAYRDRYAEVEKKGAQVVGVSTDDVETQKRFKEQQKLPYVLLSDKGGAVANQYGGTIPVLGLANRVTYVLDADGTIREIVSGKDAIDPGRSIDSCPARKG